MSLSELSRLPVSNLRLSAHISAPWTRKKMSKMQQRLARKHRSGQTEALHCFNASPSVHTGWEVEENRARLCACGLHRPACCQAPSCENRIVVCAAEAQLLGPLQNQLALTFTSAFCRLPLTWRALSQWLCTT